MYSSDKNGRLKKQIDRYFLPLQINSQFILDAIKIEDKKIQSPSKIRNETYARINEESKKFGLLRITGKQLNSNFIPISFNTPKPRTLPSTKKNYSIKQSPSNKIKDILSEPIENIVINLSKDPESYLFAEQLQELSKYRRTSYSQVELKFGKQLGSSIMEQSDNSDRLEKEEKQKVEKLMLKNRAFYQKVLRIYQLEKQKQKTQDAIRISPRKSLIQGIGNRKTTGFKKIMDNNNQLKNLNPAELRKHFSFIHYRQFLMAINVSNRIMVYPETYGTYKAYICKGNNGLLVKSIVKSRPWWCIRSYSDMENCSLVWTEWKKSKLIQLLPTKNGNTDQKNKFYIDLGKHSDSKQVEGNARNNLAAIQVIKPNGEGRNIQSKKYQLQMLNGVKNNQMLTKYLSNENESSGMFIFTKKINDKKFEELSKKYISQTINDSQKNNTNLGKRKNITRMGNHLPGCLQLHSKKRLFLNLKKYYEKHGKNIFDYVPQTFVIAKNDQEDKTYRQFLDYYMKSQQQKNNNKIKNVWICKPGENSNRGNGITVTDSLEQIKNLITNKNVNSHRTLLLQKYIQNPLLYQKRKFDIRCYMLFTSVNGSLKAYWYNEGYIRTASKEFSLKSLENKYIHLTNDAIQKKSQQYGKFQSCNKISFLEFEKYLQSIGEDSKKFKTSFSEMKQISADLVKSCAHKLNHHYKQYCFQVFGLDFMMDLQYKPFLIEANSNPCLEVDGSVLSKIIPSMIENVIRIAIDPIFPPPYNQIPKNSRFSPANPFEANKFEQIYDSFNDQEYCQKIQNLQPNIEEQQQEAEQQFQEKDNEE